MNWGIAHVYYLEPLDYIGSDLHRSLIAAEALYSVIPDGHTQKRELEKLIRKSLEECEVDIGLRWEQGKFSRLVPGFLTIHLSTTH